MLPIKLHGLMVSHGLVCFHLLCAEFLVESSVVMAWWLHIVLVSLYREDFYCAINFEW
jgi:hypothetical protein